MHNASSAITWEQTNRIDVIHGYLKRECYPGCDKLWYKSATEVLSNNKIHPIVYATVLHELLIYGRGKFCNILIVGPTNCGKTFLLKPLEQIFKTFCNPPNDKYAWLGSSEAEVILLQDFRWSIELVSWKDLLLLLEGEVVKLPCPKNHYPKDVCINVGIPVFATSKGPIEYVGKYHTINLFSSLIVTLTYFPYFTMFFVCISVCREKWCFIWANKVNYDELPSSYHTSYHMSYHCIHCNPYPHPGKSSPRVIKRVTTQVTTIFMHFSVWK